MLEYEASSKRMSEYARPDDYLKLIDYEGNSLFTHINRVEPLGDIALPFSNAANTMAVAATTNLFQCQFMAPSRENRIYHWRWYLRGTWNANYDEDPVSGGGGATDWRNLRGSYIGGLVQPEMMPPGLEVRWQHPSGTARGGVSASQALIVNGIATNIGGVQSGTIPANRCACFDNSDIGEQWDLWCIYGSFPSFEIINNSPLILSAIWHAVPSTGFPADFDIVFTGMKYIVDSVSDAEADNLKAHLPGWDYRRASVGGIPTVSTRA